MMRWGCNRRCRLSDSREWFTRIRRSSISRRQEGRCSGSSPAKQCEAFKTKNLIAITMMRRDITAGLFAPVELLLVENESGDGSTVMYDLPSSLMGIERIPALLEAAQEL